MADIPAVEWLYEPIDNCEGHIHTERFRIFFKKKVLCCTTSMNLPHDEVWRSQKSRLSQHPLPFVCPPSGHTVPFHSKMLVHIAKLVGDFNHLEKY